MIIRAAIAVVMGAFSVYAISTGRIWLRNQPVYRATEPKRFWIATIGFGIIALISLATAISH
jgi:hypothetical protein